MFRFREFMVKWRNKSYWKCSWVSELRVRGKLSAVSQQYHGMCSCCMSICFVLFCVILQCCDCTSSLKDVK